MNSAPPSGLLEGHERHRAILRILAERGQVTVAELAQRFEISAATARRDAISLSDLGRATRNHGGLVSGESLRGERHFLARGITSNTAKELVARRAAEILPYRGAVFVDAGTTCLAVGRYLLTRPELRIYTNSIPLLALADQAQGSLVSIGGEARKASMAMVGGFTQSWVSDLRFDAAVFGASGLDPSSGAYTSELLEASLKSEALRRSSLRVLVADATKWERPGAVRFGPWAAFSALVTNRDLSRESQLQLGASNVALYLPQCA